jgi:hypothetical protein
MSADRSLVIAVLALTAYGALQPAAAQTVAKPAVEANAAADTKAAEAAKAFAAGTKAFESGRTDAAVAALSTAIMSGGLKNPELAKAFFYRGVAQRTQKKPGAALSDLNAAVWLRDGLSATDKAVAEDHRQALFREIAEKSGAPTSVAAAPVANPVPAVVPAPAAATVEPAPPPAVAEPQTPSAPTWPWSAAAPAPPAAEPAKEVPPIPRAQEFVSTAPPAVEKPLPWATATDAAKAQPVPEPEPPSAATAAAAASTAAAPMLLDTIVEPVASVAAVERGTIAPVHAEPAPPEKPLPWASASVAPANSEPQPWATDAKPVQTSSAAAAVAVPPQPTVPEAAAPRTAEAVASTPVSMPAADPAPITESVGNAASAASETLAGAGQAATQFIGSLFGGSSSAPTQVAEANTAPPQSASQADAVNGDSGAQPMPRTWPTETNAATQAARVETAAISKPVEVAVREEAPAWTSQTGATPAASNPPPLATARPMPAPSDSAKAAASTASAANVIAANSAPEAVVPPSAVLPGPYRLQIAAENTREEAEQTLARLVAKHRPSLKGLEPVIEEPQTGNVLFGSMGAAYRVSLGPYVTSVEPGRLCNILQPHGFDCRVVAVTP